jgi:hypothetical protein
MSDPKKGGLLKALFSTMAAMFGVQSERNREADFTSGSPWRYLFTGVLTAVIFVFGVILLVRWALSIGGV